MREGAGSEAFSELDVDDDGDDRDHEDQEQARDDAAALTDVSPDPDPDPEPATDAGAALPWIYRRSSITDGRDQTVQLHLQQSTVDAQRDAKRALEQRFGGQTVQKADLREAALLVGLERLGAVADQLREWGYDAE